MLNQLGANFYLSQFPPTLPVAASWLEAARLSLGLSAELSAAEVYATVVQLQRLLCRAGMLAGDQDVVADGKWGDSSKAALRKFLAKHPMEKGGRLTNHLTVVVMRLESVAGSAPSAAPQSQVQGAVRAASGLTTPKPSASISSPRELLRANERKMLQLYVSLRLPGGHTKDELNAFMRERSARQYPDWLTGVPRAQVDEYFAGLDAPFGKTLAEASAAELLAEADHQRHQIAMIHKDILGGSPYSTELRFARLQDLAAELERRTTDVNVPPATRYRLAGEAGLALITLAHEAKVRSATATVWSARADAFLARAGALAAECTRLSDSGAFRGANGLPAGTFWRDTRAAGGPYEVMLARLVGAFGAP